MKRARHQRNQGLTIQPPYRFSLWIWRSWVGLIAIGWGVASAFAQPPDTSSIPTNPTLPNRSIQRIYRPTLRLESQGDYVIELQAMLTLLGYYTGSVDGVYQEDTQAAVAQFQQAAGLVPDGVVGPATWSLLLPLPPAQVSPPQTDVTATETPITPVTGTESPITATEASLVTNTSPEVTEAAEPPMSSLPPEAPPNQSSSIPAPPVENPAATQAPATQAVEPSPEDTGDTPSPIDLPTLRRGMYGAAITQLQERLQSLGIYSGVIDGVFGPETESAVIEAQRKFDLQPDGIVGPATWRAILR
ncbi:MAG: peptidoglycan-binding protein [Leptolyngbyaceae cyanobacterium MO_188.B28]|nr:peptidoglycan-binding protein [Leptolyngbyaceae cyanobacterium MO_188.B28]